MTEQILAGRYEVLRLLGKQPGRQTILARDRQTKDLAVIKLLFLGNDFEWQDLKLFEREAETLKALSHPAIPRYLDYREIDLSDNKGFALVQSYVEGKSLEEHLKAGRTFSETEVKELAKSLLKILIYLHEQNPPVIHRDIKPSNIILNNRSGHSIGQVYLVDFGSVQNQAAKFGGTITVVGTYGYMPPEQFGGRATPASDLYSLGATLIYLVTGRHPTELPQKDFRIQFQEVVNLSPALVDWLEWMTEPSLDKRLNSAIDALSALENPCIKSQVTLAVKKPEYSDVVLNKNLDYIEITLPPKGLNFVLISLVSC
ncbi:serine/threonine protein kinase, partial [Planktothrix sp. FACHB-1355]